MWCAPYPIPIDVFECALNMLKIPCVGVTDLNNAGCMCSYGSASETDGSTLRRVRVGRRLRHWPRYALALITTMH